MLRRRRDVHFLSMMLKFAMSLSDVTLTSPIDCYTMVGERDDHDIGLSYSSVYSFAS